MDARSPRPLLLLPAVVCGVGLALAGAGPASGSGGPPDPTHISEQWRVTKVVTLPREHGPWADCATARGGKGATSVQCSRGFSVANSVSGELGVTDEVLSASVGFDVTKTQTIDASARYDVPKHQQRTIQWTTRYRVKRVSTRKYSCVSGRTGTKCYAKVDRHEAVVRDAAGIGFQLVR